MPLVSFSPAVIQAASLIAPSKDIRYYLNGVHVERNSGGDFFVVSTDGSAVFIHDAGALECAQVGPWRLTIPLDVVQRLLKSKPRTVGLSALPDGRYSLAGGNGMTVEFAPVDGTFPDWRRTIPANPSGEAAMYSADLLAAAHKALALVDGVRATESGCHGRLVQNGGAPGVLVGRLPNTIVVVAPRRITAKNPMSETWLRAPY